MKRKSGYLLLACLCTFTGTIALSSCDSAQCEHSWDKGTITLEATCTTNGETLFSCTKCTETKTEPIAASHAYENGVCTVCATFDPDYMDPNFYLTLFESLATANTYLFECSDADITINFGKADGVSGASNFTVEDMKISLAFVEGELVCAGYWKMFASQTHYAPDGTLQNEQKYNLDVKMLVEDGYVYIKNGDKPVAKSPLSSHLGPLGITEEMLAAFQEIATTDKWAELFAELKSAENIPLNTVLKAIIEFEYQKETTDEGYAFTLNPDRLTEIYLILSQQKLGAIYDLVYGEGAYTELVSYAVSCVDKTVGDVVTEWEAESEEWGIDAESVYTLLNNAVNEMQGLTGENAFDIRTLLSGNKDVTLVELLNMATASELTADAYKQAINEYANTLKNTKFFELVSEGIALVNAMEILPVELPTEIDSKELGVLIQALEDKMKDCVNISFNTDKTGNILSMNVSLQDIIDDTTRQELIEQAIAAHAEAEITALLLEKLTIRLIPNGKVDIALEDIKP